MNDFWSIRHEYYINHGIDFPAFSEFGENKDFNIWLSMLKKTEEEQREILKKAHVVKKKADLLGYEDEDLDAVLKFETLLDFIGTDTEAKEMLIEKMEEQNEIAEITKENLSYLEPLIL